MSAVLGVDLGDDAVRVVVVDDAGRLLGRATGRVGPASPAAAAVAAAARAVEAAGVTVSAAGLSAVDPNDPVVQEVERALEARGLRPAARAVTTGVAGALAEAWCGSARGARHVVFLLVDERVSAGLLIGGAPWFGAHGHAGAAAWLAINPVERQDYRRSGGLAAEVSARGLVRRLIWRVEAGDASAVVDRAGGNLDAITAADVFQGAREGDGVAISVVRDTARYIGMAVANFAVTFDPEVIILGGIVADAADLLLLPVRQEAERRVAPALAPQLRIEMAALRGEAPAVGAARLAMTAGS